MYKVSKFGGSSLATKGQFEKVIDILSSDENRKYIVVSAPGKANDTKMTDLLISRANLPDKTLIDTYSTQIVNKIHSLLPVSLELKEELFGEFRKRILAKPYNKEDVIAFGEYCSAMILEYKLNKKGIEAKFVDPAEIGFFVEENNGKIKIDSSCYSHIKENLNKIDSERVIIPGFYAYTREGKLVLLPRGASDTTGTVIARAINADVCENWTDEDGLKNASPLIVKNPRTIDEMTYKESRELAYLGFKLQQDSLIPLLGTNIPLNVLNTNNPKSKGTLIVQDRIVPKEEYIIGVAAKKGFVSLNLEKLLMNEENGFGKDVFTILFNHGISYEHSPTGIDSMSIITETKYLEGRGKLNNLIKDIKEIRGEVEISLSNSLALIGVVGKGIKKDPNIVISKTLNALRNSGIHCSSMDLGASDISFFVGVDEEKSDNAVRAIYNEFFEE